MGDPIGRFLKTLATRGMEGFGKYYSIYRGYVIDNVDPMGLMRLKVQVPSVMGKNNSQWAHPIGIIAGDDRLVRILPDIGDLVWVQFETGDRRFPIWTYGHPVAGDITKEVTDKDSWHFSTPYGHTISIEKDAIIVKFLEGTSITLTKESIILNKEDHGGLLTKDNIKEELEKVIDSISSLKDVIRQDLALAVNSSLTPIPQTYINTWTPPSVDIQTNDSVKH